MTITVQCLFCRGPVSRNLVVTSKAGSDRPLCRCVFAHLKMRRAVVLPCCKRSEVILDYIREYEFAE